MTTEEMLVLNQHLAFLSLVSGWCGKHTYFSGTGYSQLQNEKIGLNYSSFNQTLSLFDSFLVDHHELSSKIRKV